jgi:hypothetical protein
MDLMDVIQRVFLIVMRLCCADPLPGSSHFLERIGSIARDKIGSKDEKRKLSIPEREPLCQEGV